MFIQRSGSPWLASLLASGANETSSEMDHQHILYRSGLTHHYIKRRDKGAKNLPRLT